MANIIAPVETESSGQADCQWDATIDDSASSYHPTSKDSPIGSILDPSEVMTSGWND